MNAKPKLLTEDQWLAAHKPRFDKLKLGLVERRKRYAAYASSAAGQRGSNNSAVAIPRSVKSSKSRTGPQFGGVDNEKSELLMAMIDPFRACSREGHLPRIPDGSMKQTGVYKFKFNVDIYSNQSGRAFFMLDACPFRAYATGSTISDIDYLGGTDVAKAEAGFVANAEFNAFTVSTGRANNNVGFTPPWTEGSWSIPIVRSAQDNVVPPTTLVAQNGLGMQPAVGASSLQDLAQSWRPVCAGMKFKNTAKVLDRQGAVAVARWPGSLGLPTVSNQLLVVQTNTIDYIQPGGYAGQGPNFNTVQTLPDAEVFAVSEGFTAIWAPTSSEAHAMWRPVHPKPLFSPATFEGLGMFSDTETTGIYILPDPCMGDPSEYKALIDRLYTQNANVESNLTGLTPVTYGDGKALYFQPLTNATAAENDEATSYALRDLLHGHNQTSIIYENNALIACFEGCDPETLLGTMEVCIGVEYVADSRVVTTGNGPDIQAKVNLSKSKQIDIHEASIQAVNAVPPAVATASGMADAVVNGIGNVAGAIETAAPYVEAALTALGAFL